ncbi:hypothetical protein T440DRAFT_322068 [Plenodomus tracheiphilus IPT5]|uniref:UBC core domain-containing protein n=1 Tax=Plenodomus tracheiphilus IPT5 TaxID=1408161 RepID=A0A6A7BCM0_9PLEO|nr:hypothetical protein T440DRAFT_322068 [Plenodomus tracheiphilus IPT5]
MSLPASLPVIPSFRKQHLLVEFSSLRYAQLDGVFVSITPGDPSLWVGVIFVRKGPYAPAVLRFQVSFPAGYPTLPPLVTFSTDVFHPLLTPLTTYTYTTGSSEAETVSATDEERLPPGGFSLRHGFPHWFGRAQRSVPGSRNVSASAVIPSGQLTPTDAASNHVTAGSTNASIPKDISMVRVLEYMRSTFSDGAVLDALPLEAAANPGAYHAWRTHRGLTSQIDEPDPASPKTHAINTGNSAAENSTLGRNRRPGAWNWEGVWEERVKKAVKASLSDPVLYGSSVGEDIIRFRDGDDESLDKMRIQLEATSRNATET